MTLEFKKKESEEMDDLPGDEEGKDPVIEPEDVKHRLELENAELRGRQAERERLEKKPDAAINTHEQNKQRVLGDANSLSDDDFEKIYKIPKHQAVATMLDRDNQITKYESKKAIAEAEAKTELSTKYGADFYRFKAEIESALEDLSPEARQDPKRVASFMDRTYRSLSTEKPKPNSKEVDASRRKIVSDFKKPEPDAEHREKQIQEEDLVEEQHRPLASVLGLRSEKERKEMMDLQAKGGYVPMNMGGGKWFKDPSRGFEKVDPAK